MSEELQKRRAELVEEKETAWVNLNRLMGAIAILDELIEKAEKAKSDVPPGADEPAAVSA